MFIVHAAIRSHRLRNHISHDVGCDEPAAFRFFSHYRLEPLVCFVEKSIFKFSHPPVRRRVVNWNSNSRNRTEFLIIIMVPWFLFLQQSPLGLFIPLRIALLGVTRKSTLGNVHTQLHNMLIHCWWVPNRHVRISSRSNSRLGLFFSVFFLEAKIVQNSRCEAKHTEKSFSRKKNAAGHRRTQ